MDESDFKASYKQIRGRSLELFHKKAVGSGVQEPYLLELKQKLSLLYEQIREENSLASDQACLQFLN
jgi:hypothetical protein